ncbi:MAG TPA: chemotaxis protein CheA [Gemmatimonadaceae bacterium]|jgi:two-component system chemotaxis sensor kinase CheA|nr:chemotaxis protein CheA [Gemmatimonadaceae bacterium]
MDLSKYADLFLTESREHLSAINAQLLELERAPGAGEPVAAIFRSVHTIKGMSATMGYTRIAELTHELETLLERMRRGEQPATPEVMDLLFRAADALEVAIEAVVKGEEAGDVTRLIDRLKSVAGAKSGKAGARAARRATTALPRPMEAPQAPRHARIELKRLDALMNLVGELVIARGRLQSLTAGTPDPALQETVTQAGKLIAELQDEIMVARMVPVAQIFDRFPRLVRDGVRALGKEIEFTLEGKEIELDRSMLDEIGDPIVHLLRNAIDHGIELPDERVAAGKPRAGRLTLSALRERSSITIRVSDDGRGIDRAKVLRKAADLGLIDDAARDIGDEELIRLIARPGFSTAEEVTGLSGRGVGVDAVYTRVRSLGGGVEIRTTPGQGTTVTVRLPVTLAIVRALLARVEQETYAVPLTHVSETAELSPDALRTVKGHDVLVMRDEVLPLIRFRRVVRLPEAPRPRAQVIVLEMGDRRAGLLVDELTGQQDIVVKPFDGVQDGVGVFSGATILADGAPALIVDVGSLL